MTTDSRTYLFRILRVTNRLEIHRRKRATRTATRAAWWFFGLQLVLLVGAVALGIIYYLGAAAVFGTVGLVMLLVYYIAVLATPLATTWLFLRSNKEAMKNPIRNPFEILLWNASITSAVDARILPIIMRCPLNDIELMLLEVRSEKESFERRVALVVGAIEKIGILPGLLAILVSLQNLPNQSFWVSSLAYAMAILYICGLGAHYQLMRLERMLKMLNLAVVWKKEALTNPSSRDGPLSKVR